MRTIRRLLLAWVFVVLLAPAVRAQEPSSKAAAETLFVEARSLLDAGKHDEACAKFALSHKLDPAVGTLLNLGECNERRGRIASAWVNYREAVALASARGDKRREGARAKVDALEPRLRKLELTAKGELPAGVEVTVDEAHIDAAGVGTPMPVDPGPHRVSAKAPGRRAWSTQVDAPAEGASRSLVIPDLEPMPVSPQSSADPAADVPRGSGQRTVGVALGILGLVGLGVGSGFALVASGKWSDVTRACPDGRCPDAATRDAQGSASDTAYSFATFSNVAFIVGGLALATGVILYLTAPSRPTRASARAEPSR